MSYRKKLSKIPNGDLEMQIIDWSAHDYWQKKEDNDDEDEEEDDNKFKNSIRKYLIKIYGITAEGYSICMVVNDFHPSFFVRIPDDWVFEDCQRLMKALHQTVKYYNRESCFPFEIVKKKEFYGFTNNHLFKFMKLQFRTYGAFYEYRQQLEKPVKLDPYDKKTYKFQLYESNILPLLRFIHHQNISPAAWVQVKSGKYGFSKMSKCQIEINVNWKDVNFLDKSDIGKIMIASFDIECVSEDGSFPVPSRAGDKVIQIGTTVHLYGDKECFLHHIITLGKCAKITEKEVEGQKLVVESYETEKEVILAWAKFIEELDPDIITGYNIWGFDMKYLYERAENGCCGETFNFTQRFLELLSRNKLRPSVFIKDKELSSSAMGNNLLNYIEMEGRVGIDLMKVVQRDHKLDSYKLDFVASWFLKMNKIDLSPREIFANFKKGGKENIKEIAVYCLKDCVLVNKLVMTLEIIANNIGMANVCLVPFSYLFLRGQGIKIFSLVAKYTMDEGYCLKVIKKDDSDKTGYEGAIVFTPKSGIYMEPVAVNDYASLYPSSMIAENISHDSIVWTKIFNVKNVLLMVYNGHGTLIQQYDDDGNLIMKKEELKYLGVEGYNYQEISYDNFEKYEEKRHKNVPAEYIIVAKPDNKVKTGYTVCCFVEAKDGSKSALPRILMKLLAARKSTRKRILYKTVELGDGRILSGLLDKDKGEIICEKEGKVKFEVGQIVKCEDTYNEFMKAVWDGLQLSYKVSCNSLYGQCGAKTSSIYYKQLSACTTRVGRGMLIMAKEKILEKFAGVKLVYGDSVSGDTPLLLRDMDDGKVEIKTIETLCEEWGAYEEFKPWDSNRREKQQGRCDYEVWSQGQWTAIKRVIRHKTEKRMFRVNTFRGCVDVSEDHSLIDINGEKVKPTDLNENSELMHTFPTEFKEFDLFDTINKEEVWGWGFIMELVPKIILNASYEIRKLFFEGYYEANGCKTGEYSLEKGKIYFCSKGKISAQGLYYLASSLGYKNLSIRLQDGKENIYFIGNLSEEYMEINKNKIRKIIELPKIDGDKFIYDLETEFGKFHCGVGETLCFNTDSCMMSFIPYIQKKHPDEELTEYRKMELTSKYCQEAADYITSIAKRPHVLEFEKIFYPFIIFSKKRYVGNKYMGSITKFKQDSMGIVLKRRDNAPIVKEIYGGIIDTILNKRDIEASKVYFKDKVAELLEGKANLQNLIITKTLRTGYKNPTQIAHKVLADRIKERDAGNAPLSNDRIPYCFIDVSNLRCVMCHSNGLNTENCKCILCMQLFCRNHINKHKEKCRIICRFCRKDKNEIDLRQCDTCKAYYCQEDYNHHFLREDKYGNEHHDKCKKPLTKKILQGDILELPSYIQEKELVVDYGYYLERQIKVPCLQIFSLVMPHPESLIEDSVRRYNNKKQKQTDLSCYFGIGIGENKKEDKEEVGEVEVVEDLFEDLSEEDDGFIFDNGGGDDKGGDEPIIIKVKKI